MDSRKAASELVRLAARLVGSGVVREWRMTGSDSLTAYHSVDMSGELVFRDWMIEGRAIEGETEQLRRMLQKVSGVGVLDSDLVVERGSSRLSQGLTVFRIGDDQWGEVRKALRSYGYKER